MIGTMQDSVLNRAIELATRAHSGMTRKKTGTPYILHPMEVAAIAGTLTLDEEVMAAAMLHDTVEDTELTLEEIRAACGERVAALVASETENKRPELPPEQTWRIRKEESLEELSRAAGPETKILWLSDKLSNMRSIYSMWLAEGDGLWRHFNEKRPAEQAWYYRSIARLLEDMKDTDAWKEYIWLVKTVFRGVE